MSTPSSPITETITNSTETNNTTGLSDDTTTIDNNSTTDSVNDGNSTTTTTTNNNIATAATTTSSPTTTTTTTTSSYTSTIPTTTSHINPTTSTSTTSTSSGGGGSGNLFISFLPATYTSDTLRSLFSAFGEIESCRVMVDLTTGLSKGFGFVKFRDMASAQYAINSMNGAKFENKTLLVRFANSDPTSNSNDDNDHMHQSNELNEQKVSNNVFIKGLPVEFDKNQLSELFGTYGTVLESKLLIDITTNASRGQGLVRFADVHSAINAVRALNGYVLQQDPEKQLVVRFADNEDEKKQKRLKLQQKQMRQTMRFSPYPQQQQQQQQMQQTNLINPATMGMYPFYQAIPTTTVAMPTMNSLPNTIIGSSPQPQAGGGKLPGSDPTNLYVYNLPSDADDSLLYRLFSPCGAIASVKIIRDQTTQVCRGYGFVRMVSLADSYSAINSINGVQVGGKTISVSFKK